MAYATVFSIGGVLVMSTAQMLDSNHIVYGIISVVLLTHLSLTLVLVALRINSIGRSDRIDALIAHTRGHSNAAEPGPVHIGRHDDPSAGGGG